MTQNAGMVDRSVVTDPFVPTRVKLLYALIATYADDERTASISRRDAERQLGMSVRTVDAATRDAEQCGLMRVDRRPLTPNVFHLLDFGRGFTPSGSSGKTPQRADRKSTSAALRLAVITRDQGRCRYCAETVDLAAAHLDHVAPHCEGGPRTLDNLVLACPACNSAKGTQHWTPLPVPERPSRPSDARGSTA